MAKKDKPVKASKEEKKSFNMIIESSSTTDEHGHHVVRKWRMN